MQKKESEKQQTVGSDKLKWCELKATLPQLKYSELYLLVL